mmetsp:Transcript_7209/g.13717  ORF Transcript_7209/g.13717 Transcript_7209/m.13717 type:complete len:104 (-) Transcript_7209:942-1253(-)|eukprot:CAMPEP_0174313330 /NCGR_PEP_ID=MMETSP0810-20121108/4906_1 /TAXON_ID=73025 ORGANISM="Eutreptiella gymnastica-like, Strain CCMP1594" /NCGR_SAMPLE_ID=MMETSP0810 /ASSEMBLY_ACC=CAM_ASM_000659 /LENGTH=103 /DNA_ID=CAMNT_0015422063 /DNA_START=31 /DNA_END=342 /DNA_ORIENTATION=-
MSHTPQQKVELIFKKFDKDMNGFWSFAEMNDWQYATEGWKLEMDAFEEICSHIGADPAKGYSLQQLSQMYLNKSIPEELQLNLEEDWQKLFASQASKKGFMVL